VHGIREIASGQTKDQRLWITYIMKNYGRTIGWTTNITFQCAFDDKFWGALPKDLKYDRPPQSETEANYPIMPDIPFPTLEKVEIYNFSITQEHAKKILAGKSFLFVYGFIKYRDLFENSHISNFAYCYRFKDDVKSDYPEPVGHPEHWKNE
jgi:hypothetical protein